MDTHLLRPNPFTISLKIPMKLILLLSTSLALTATSFADLKKIDGTWKPFAGTMGGKALSKAMLDTMVIVIKNGTYDYSEGHGHDYGDLKEIGTKAPLGMDIIGTKGPNKGMKYVTIYKMEGKTLVICYGLDGKRPKAFDEKSKGLTMLMKYHKTD